MSATRVLIPPKRVGEKVQQPFDFAGRMLAGDTITGAAVVVTVYSGVDPTPANVFVSTVISGSIIFVNLQAGVVGVIYNIAVTATVGIKLLELDGLLAIIPQGM